ncbi:MAG: ATP-binding protein [Acidobacteriaceae bacterium]|nr:ATP-binding protein [Acidobacteriaceae bacterium]
MRTFFIQLFLAFWIATIGIFIGATLFFPGGDPGSPETMHLASDVSMEKLTMDALQRYSTQGCSGIGFLSPQFTLVDERTRPLCSSSSSLEPTVQKMLADAGTTPNLGRRVGADWIQVRAFSEGGKGRWFLVQRTPYMSRRAWPPFPLSAIPISILVTLLFAYLITRPIRALSRAFRRFTAGDLDTRLTISPRRWGDVGGADVRTLMLDFNHMADRIHVLLEAQKLLMRDISHELRSPLARLRVVVELAREDAIDPLPWMDDIERQVDRVNDLIGEMLTLSLMESTRTVSRKESFTIGELFDDLIPDMNLEAQARGCGLVFEGTNEESRIAGRQELLRRALENIIRNGIRYAPAGSVVEVEVGRKPASDSDKGYSDSTAYMEIAVRDEGPGVPESSLSQIFRPFYRGNTSQEYSTGGFGLGLAIAERAIQIHSGRITAVNRPTGGLEIIIFLPIDFPKPTN